MAHVTQTRSLAALVLVVGVGVGFGCSADSDGETAGQGASGNFGGGGSGGGSAASGGGSNGGSGGLNIGGSSGSGTGGSAANSGCEKIDFLFIVDNSVSMENEQAQLVAAFPGFITTIESTVNAGSDYHVMVTDTDEWGRCNTANPWTGMNPTSTTCNNHIKTSVFEECDRTLGAGVVHPAGQFASNTICSFPLPRRYLQQGDTDVAGTFACAAQVGTAGHPSERPMDSMVAALQPGLNGPSGCNEGFLRDDAILVITFISDDPNYEDAGTPQDWYDAVVAAKKGDPSAVAVVGFTPNFTGCGGNGDGTKGSHWSEFIAKFPFSLEASVCDPDYNTTFNQAVQIIDETCEQYVPPVE